MLPKPLKKRIDLLKHSGHRGGVIGVHRSYARTIPRRQILLSIFLIPLLFTILMAMNQEQITILWYGIFEFWFEKLSLIADVRIKNDTILYHPIVFPYPYVGTNVPGGSQIVWGFIINVVVILIIAQLIAITFAEKNLAPLVYFLRIIAFINFTAVIYFILRPKGLWFSVESYISGCLSVGYKYLFLLPWILGLTYNIYDVKIRYKFLLPVVMLGYFLIFLPVLFLFHAYILANYSTLYLPVLFLLFTFLPVMAMTVAFYGIFLSVQVPPKSEYE